MDRKQKGRLGTSAGEREREGSGEAIPPTETKAFVQWKESLPAPEIRPLHTQYIGLV